MQNRFRGVLEAAGKPLNWVLVRVPFDTADACPIQKRLRVQGTINDFPFHTTLFGSKANGYVLLVNRTMRKAADVSAGSEAEIVLQTELEDPPDITPPELAKLLKKERTLKKWFEQLSPSMRKGISNRITAPKSDAARVRQAEHWAEAMMLAMEGELELPPILQVAFQRQPHARAGWKAMTTIQRRSHLLAIFQYQGADARARRAEQAVEDALRVAKRARNA